MLRGILTCDRKAFAHGPITRLTAIGTLTYGSTRSRELEKGCIENDGKHQ
jgi:hypothetical protein